MGLFDFLKRKKKDETIQDIYIQGDFLYYKEHLEIEKVDLSKLKYAYANMLGPNNLYLILFDYKQHYINTHQEGYTSSFKELVERFSFDIATYNKISKSNEEQKEVIWRRKNEKNYKISSFKNFDLAEGFEVQTSPPQVISWDTTYDDFLTLDIGHLYQNESNHNYYKVDFPVRLGTIIFHNFEFYFDNNRKDIPVQTYFSEVYDDSNTDISFNELKDEWLKMIPTNLDEAGYERDDQRSLSFRHSDISFEILYTYNVGSGYDNGSTFFYIRNERDYRDRILKPYNAQINRSNISSIPLNVDLNFFPKYESSPNFVLNPEEIDAEIPTQLWYDKANNRIGFTNNQHSIVYETQYINYIIIQNVLPAKGGGYAELLVQLQEGYPEAIYFAELNSLDKYEDEIKNLTGLQVIIPEPYYNC